MTTTKTASKPSLPATPPPSSPLDPVTPAGATPAIAVPTSLVSRYQISPASFLEQARNRGPGAVDHLVAGAVVAHRGRVLVLQRSRDDYLGLTWEVPGGSVDADDDTILGAACRELWEETGLRVISILDIVEDAHDWVDEGSVWRKMTFLVDVAENGEGSRVGGQPVVRLDPDEHEDFAWITEQEALEDRCGEGKRERVLTWTSAEQKLTILDAFKLLRSRRADDDGDDDDGAAD